MTEVSALPNRWADIGLRTLTSLILVPVALADVWLGGDWYIISLALLGVLIAHEYSNIAFQKSSSHFALNAAAGLIAALMPAMQGMHVTALALLVLMAIAVGLGVFRVRGFNHFWHFISVPYIGLPILSLALLRQGETFVGVLAILWVLFIVWGADVTAYFFGRLIGGPKLAPVLSPKKTWAGLGGAVFGAAAISVAFTLYTGNSGTFVLAMLAAILALFEQAGDIFESAFKRYFGVKDSGTIIPGHGGVLDRVDGLMVVAMIAAIVGYLRNPSNIAEGLMIW